MKNKNILAITLAETMGFVNAGIFDDIVFGLAGVSSKIPAFTNPIVVTSIIANILLFFIIFPMITPKLAPKIPELTGNAMNGDDLRHNWIQKDN
jgi:hypothetical protein